MATFEDYRPDPSELTTKQLHREITVLRELIDARFDGIEKAIDQRFNAVGQQFENIENQRVEQKMDTKAAVDAALTAQKEAVKEQTIASDRAIAKSDGATTKQIEQLATNFATSLASVGVQMNDAKERIVKIESIKVGGESQTTKTIAIIGASAAVVAIIVAVVTFMANK